MPTSTNPTPSRPRFLPFLLLLFVASGCAALIYEIVWFQLLEFVIGSSAISIAVLLGTFMGGMCLGSLALPRLVSARRHPLRVYALLELGVGILGVAVLFGMPHVAHLFGDAAGYGPAGIFLRAMICVLCLLPPTILMGATLPAVSRWLDTTPAGISWLGYFYGGNTAGAVSGCVLAGFYLLRVHDMPTATWVAAAINLGASLLGFALAALAARAWSERGPGLQPTIRETPGEKANAPAPSGSDGITPWGKRSVHLAIALSGMSALGAEVVWTRLLSLMLGPTVYTFSIILAVFLLGIGLGGSAGAYVARESVRPRRWFALCQLLLAVCIAWAAYMAARSLPYWPVNESAVTGPWFRFQLDLVRCLWAILPAALLWGASFPLALAAVASPGQDPGRLVGGVYAANTVGAIIGAVTFSLCIVPWIGTQQAERVLIGLGSLSAFLLCARTPQPASRRPLSLLGWSGAAIAVLALLLSVPQTPGELIAYGRTLLADTGTAKILYMGEGRNSSVAVSETDGGVRNFHVAGKVEASTTSQDMRLQRMLGHLPAMLHPGPKSVLIVGCGAGVTAGSFVKQPGIERIVICEIEPLIPGVVAEYFAKQNYGVVRDPRVQIVYDDARHFVLTTKEKFDIITSDPIHPWVKGSASLYTQEYFQLCKDHLNPGGMVTQWIPLYESDEASVKSEIATFFRVFPQGTLWGNDVEGAGYDAVVLGQNGPPDINVNDLSLRWQDPSYAASVASLLDVGFQTPLGLLSTYAGQASDLAPWLADAEINRDRNLRLQYLAGLGVDSSMEAAIYKHILAFRKFPEGLFIASEQSQRELRNALDNEAADR